MNLLIRGDAFASRQLHLSYAPLIADVAVGMIVVVFPEVDCIYGCDV